MPPHKSPNKNSAKSAKANAETQILSQSQSAGTGSAPVSGPITTCVFLSPYIVLDMLYGLLLLSL